MSNKADFINAAIREKRERERGCEYCNGEYPSSFLTIEIDNNDISADDIHVEFVEPLRYCPMCGKSLNTRATSGESEGT